MKFALRTSKGITFVCLLSYSVVKEPTSAERAAILAEPSRPCQAECFQALARMNRIPSDPDTTAVLLLVD